MELGTKTSQQVADYWNMIILPVQCDVKEHIFNDS